MSEAEFVSRRNYHAYLLRLWQEEQTGDWRASLENPSNGTVLRFANAAEAWMYLVDQMNPQPIAQEGILDELLPPREV